MTDIITTPPASRRLVYGLSDVVRSMLAAPNIISMFAPGESDTTVPVSAGQYRVYDLVNPDAWWQAGAAAGQVLSRTLMPGVTCVQDDSAAPFGLTLQRRDGGAGNPLDISIGPDYPGMTFIGCYYQATQVLGRLGGFGDNSDAADLSEVYWGLRGAPTNSYVAYSSTAADWLLNTINPAGSPFILCVTCDYLTGRITSMVNTVNPDSATNAFNKTISPALLPQKINALAIGRRPENAAGTAAVTAAGPCAFFGANYAEAVFDEWRAGIIGDLAAALDIDLVA